MPFGLLGGRVNARLKPGGDAIVNRAPVALGQRGGVESVRLDRVDQRQRAGDASHAGRAQPDVRGGRDAGHGLGALAGRGGLQHPQTPELRAVAIGAPLDVAEHGAGRVKLDAGAAIDDALGRRGAKPHSVVHPVGQK